MKDLREIRNLIHLGKKYIAVGYGGGTNSLSYTRYRRYLTDDKLRVEKLIVNDDDSTLIRQYILGNNMFTDYEGIEISYHYYDYENNGI